MRTVEIRRDERVRALLRARILFNNGNSSMDCTVRNIAAGGAKIEISSALTVPSEFDLDVPQKGRIYRAKLVWRDATFIGVAFVEKNACERAETEVVRLEQENSRLKATVVALTRRLEALGQDVSNNA